MSMMSIIITVDANDADYNTKVSKISKKDLDKIKPLIAAIKKFKPYKTCSENKLKRTHCHNYPYGDFSPRSSLGEKSATALYPEFDEDIHEMFTSLCPFGEHGWHTIESIYIAPYTKGKKLL